MTRTEKHLSQIYADLPAEERETLLAFAEFLHSRTRTAAKSTEIQPIPRPGEESVVAAIKRLSATYPMLDKAVMLNHTSALMTQHVMYGRAADAVIDELENLFDEHYRRLQQDLPE